MELAENRTRQDKLHAAAQELFHLAETPYFPFDTKNLTQPFRLYWRHSADGSPIQLVGFLDAQFPGGFEEPRPIVREPPLAQQVSYLFFSLVTLPNALITALLTQIQPLYQLFCHISSLYAYNLWY